MDSRWDFVHSLSFFLFFCSSRCTTGLSPADALRGKMESLCAERISGPLRKKEPAEQRTGMQEIEKIMFFCNRKIDESHCRLWVGHPLYAGDTEHLRLQSCHKAYSKNTSANTPKNPFSDKASSPAFARIEAVSKEHQSCITEERLFFNLSFLL